MGHHPHLKKGDTVVLLTTELAGTPGTILDVDSDQKLIVEIHGVVTVDAEDLERD